MPENLLEVTSPTEAKGDAKVKSGNISGQAAVQAYIAATLGKPEATQSAKEIVTPKVETPPETTESTAEVPATSEVESPEVTPETTEEVTPEPEADTVPSQHSFTAEQQELFNKRIGKEVAKTKAVEARLKAEYEAKISELQSKVEPPQTPQAPMVISTEQPLSHIHDFAELGKLKDAAEQAIEYAEDVLRRPSQWRVIEQKDPVTGNDVQVKVHVMGEGANQAVFTEDSLLDTLKKAKRTANKEVPQREAYLKTQSLASQEAVKRFGFLADKNTPEYQMVQAARRNPANAPILAMPNADYVLGLLIKGEMASRAESEAAKAKPVIIPKKIAPKPPSDQTAVSASTAPTREPAGNREASKKQQAVKDSLKKGNINPQDAAKLLR